jgi:hypothetical protein
MGSFKAKKNFSVITLAGSAGAIMSAHAHPGLPAGEDLFSIMMSAVASTDKQVYLVAKDGTSFPCQEAVLKASSNFFSAALDNGMRETSKIPPFAHLSRYNGPTMPVLIL